ncbi:MAG: glycosyltransferase [Capnocytophaga sp.]|nr:glycosyltransferase [Capnocytophaga sp.]
MKKVLIITYYWTPAGGPGVQRWLKFVKYLRDFNIEPIIYIPENPTYPIIDENIGNDLPKNITILKKKIIEPYTFASLFSKEKTKKISAGIIPSKQLNWLDKLFLWVRGNIFIPDARILWVKPSVKYLEKYITDNQIDTIITTAPPHSVHLIGKELKKRLNIRWIADFRDPWTNIGYHSELRLTKKSAKKHYDLEKSVLQTADSILVTSPTTKKEFEEKTRQPITLITNGFDDDSFKNIRTSDKFLVSHIGSLLTERNPKTLWRVLNELILENKDFANDFQLCLAGKISDEVISDLKTYNLYQYTDFKGYISHNDAIELQHYSQVLLLLEINHEKTQGIIPGKLFEYMASSRPILAIGYKDWDAGEIIKETNTGKVLAAEDYQNIKKVILNYYELYKKGELFINSQKINPYHRKELTRKLSELLLRH